MFYICFSLLLVLGALACKPPGSGHENPGDQVTDTTSENPGYSAFRAEPFHAAFKGELAEKYPIMMELESDGQSLKGTYRYEGKMGNTYHLEGRSDWSGAFSLSEKDAKGQLRSTFEGYFTHRYRMDGTWSSAEGAEPIPFTLFSTPPPGAEMVEKSDSVTGMPGLLLFKHAIYCPQCDCAVRLHYPQLVGTTTPEQQKEVNRSLREIVFRSIIPGCDGFKETDRVTEEYTFRPGMLNASTFSGVLLSPSGSPRAGLIYNLHTGDFEGMEALTRDKQALLAFLLPSLPGADAQWDRLQAWTDPEGIHIFIPDSQSIIIPWSHPQLTAWFRNLPPVS